MKKRLLAGIFAVSLFLFSGCGQAKETPEETIKPDTAVEVQAVSSGTISTEHNVSGKVVSGDQESVYVSLSARCIDVYVEVGDTVKTGTPICKLDVSSTRSNYETASLNYENAVQSYQDQSALFDLQIAQSEKNVSDTETLLRMGAASQTELDNAKLALENLKVTRTSTLSQLEVGMKNYQFSMEQLETSLENIDAAGTIHAPISGVISNLSAAKNSFVSSAAPVVVLESTSNMEISAAISDALIAKLHVGDQASVSISSFDQTFESIIQTIDKTADPATHLYPVTMNVPSSVQGLLSGMFAEITFQTDARDNTIVIPTEAILTRDNGQFVFTVDENQVAHQLLVQTGLAGDGVTEITSGLVGGETLVTVGQFYLSDGQTVRIVPSEE